MKFYTSREIRIGELLVGGKNPIRLQSMTNTNTLDTVATVNQVIRMVEAGCDLVRITAPGIKEAVNLEVIKKRLRSEGIRVPLIADIHFNPKAAEVAASLVEKIRINPGNYVGKSGKRESGKVDICQYSDAQYQQELELIASNLRPLLSICKQNGTAIRIGVNQGSLGNRIVSKYGDTVEGMVVSALEFARICRAMDYNELVLSVKSSNPKTMLQAYRDLAIRLQQEDLNFPLHLGVTEAGDGEDGRMKSIAGIGAVLTHGLGDTIRVSLTEDPEKELPVAKAIKERFNIQRQDGLYVREVRNDLLLKQLDPTFLNDRETFCGFPNAHDPIGLVLKDGTDFFIAQPDGSVEKLAAQSIVHIYSVVENTDEHGKKAASQGNIQTEITESTRHKLKYSLYGQPLKIADILPKVNSRHELAQLLKQDPVNSLIIQLPASETTELIQFLRESGCINPILLMSCAKSLNMEEVMIENCIHPGTLMLDGLGQGLCIDAGGKSKKEIIDIGFGILQATRSRITRTDYIACPSCGRTNFNIQQRLQEVKAATSHLIGLKIAVMGCIVNGPGEMADADYGYVGAGSGKVTLYKGKHVMKQSVPEDHAVDELLKIINSFEGDNECKEQRAY